MLNNQPLSGMEVRLLAERMVRAKQGSDTGLESIIENMLREYIMIPRSVIAGSKHTVTLNFGPSPIQNPEDND